MDKLHSVHHRHLEIRYDGPDLLGVQDKLLRGVGSVICYDDLVAIFDEHIANNFTDFLFVVHH